MPQEREIVPRPDNKYCPKCGAIYKEGERFCSQCGANLTEQKSISKEKTEKPDDPTLKKKKRKKKIIALVIIICLLLLGGGALAYYYYNKSNTTNKNYEDQINKQWSEIVDKSDSFKNDLQNVDEQKDLVVLSDKSMEIERLTKNKLTEIESVTVPKGYEDSNSKYKTALTKYAEYQSKLRFNILDKSLANIKVSSDFSTVQKYADNAKDAISNFEKVSKFLKDTMNQDVFNLAELKSFVEEWQGKEISDAEKKAKEEAEKQKAAEQQTAERTVNDFMASLPSAYSQPPANQWAEAQRIADKYWYTPSMNNFRSNYKFYFDGTPGAPKYLGGQVIKIERASDTKFDVSTEEREKYTGPDHENKFLTYFIVEKVGTTGWFISSHGRR